MALYKVLPHCSYFDAGAFVETDEHGYVQEVQVKTENGRLVPMGFKGLCIPLEWVKHDLLKIQKAGLDRPQRW